MKVLHKWVMFSHDVVVMVRQKAWDSNPGVSLHVWMIRAELQQIDREVNPRTCVVTRLPGILIVSPQGTAIHLCCVDPVGKLSLLMLLDLLREVLES